MTSFGHNFLPGPTDVHPEVLQAMLEPMYSHRGPRFKLLLREIQPHLQSLFRTKQPVFITTSSATGLMEAAIRSGVEYRVLVVVGGYFGEMWARIAESCGKEVVRLVVPPGETVEPEQLEHFLDGPDIDAVALTHSESGTGALAPLEGLAMVVHRKPGVLLLVDGVTSVGGTPVETDAWGLDFVLTGSQKALAIPPGLALGVASQRFVERSRSIDDRGWYFNIPDQVRMAEQFTPEHTVAISLYHALACQLRRIEAAGGLEARWRRHEAMRQVISSWVEHHPQVRFLAREGRRSPTISALRLNATSSAIEIAEEMEQRGWLISTCMGSLAKEYIRIGHLGDLEPEHLSSLLSELERFTNA